MLADLDFSIRENEIVGFLGANGSGKTTTFLLASGFLAPQSGEVRVMGVQPDTSRAWCESVGVVMARSGHYTRLTVRRNLAFFAELHGVDAELESHLEAYGLTSVADTVVGKLSHGFRQRLTLARATVHNPRLLLLDEPSDGLDPQSTDRLYRTLRESRDQGRGVLLTSHRVEEVEAVCDRLLLLKDGKIAVSGTPQELKAESGESLRDQLLSL